MKKITFLLIALLVVMVSYSQVVINESFEGNSIPTGWSQSPSNNFAWSFGSSIMPGTTGVGSTDFSTNAAIFNDDAAGNTGNHNFETLELPSIDFTSNNNSSTFIKVEYTYALNVLSPEDDRLFFAVKDANNSTFHVIAEYDQDTDPTDVTLFIELASTSVTIDPSNVEFIFVYDDIDSDWAWGAGVDNVKITLIPNNDVCGNAQEMTSFPYTNIQDTTGSINEGFVTPTGCSGGMNDGVWYTFTSVGDGEVNIQSLTSGYDHEIGVYTGSCDNFTCVANKDGSLTGQPEYLSFNVTFGTQYWINFGYWSNSTDGASPGNLEVHMSYTPTANDICAQGQDAGAVTLPVQTNMANFASTTPYAGTVLGATDSGIAATVCEGYTGNPNDDVWFKFIATTENLHITVEENFDSVINLYSGTCGSLSQIGCADNIDISPVQIDANGLTVGDEYYVRVFSFDNSTNNNDSAFNISVWSEDSTAEINEDIIEGLTLYPNPINDILNIKAQEKITKLSIYNPIGQLLKTIIPNNTNVTVNLDYLATGIYIVKIEANGGVNSRRVIKK